MSKQSSGAQKQLTVNVVSETPFTARGHGVHTAFVEMVDSLRANGQVRVLVNSNLPADIIHIHTVGPYSLRRLLFGAGKKVVSAHVTPDSFVGSLVGAKTWYGLARAYLRWFYNRADLVCAVSSEVVEELGRMGVKKPIMLTPNTINTAKYRTTASTKKAARQKLGIKDGQFVVVCVGQVQPRKRVESFIACAKKLSQMQFIWVGGVPFGLLAADYAGAKEQIAHPPGNVKFTGVIELGEVVQYYQAADLFFLPSAQETFGIVIVEAAAAGLPVLLRDLNQYRDTFGDTYLAGDDHSFAGLIHRLSTDSQFYRQQKQKSRQIAERYDSRVGAQRLIQAYRQLLAGQKPGL